MLLTILRKRPREPENMRILTLGRMLVDGVHECFTEEPPMRDDSVFVAGESALPAGHTYAVSLPKSAFYARNVPLAVSAQLLGAGGARIAIGMRIVPGHYTLDNFAAGIVVGKTQNVRNVHHTRLAYDQLLQKLLAAKFDRGEAIELEILIDDD